MGCYGNNDWRDYRGGVPDHLAHSEYGDNDYRDYLAHYGVKGMKWGKITSGLTSVGGKISSGAQAVGGAVSNGINHVLTLVGLRKNPKRKHTRGKAKKRKKVTGYQGGTTYRHQMAAYHATNKLRNIGK